MPPMPCWHILEWHILLPSSCFRYQAHLKILRNNRHTYKCQVTNFNPFKAIISLLFHITVSAVSIRKPNQKQQCLKQCRNLFCSHINKIWRQVIKGWDFGFMIMKDLDSLYFAVLPHPTLALNLMFQNGCLSSTHPNCILSARHFPEIAYDTTVYILLARTQLYGHIYLQSSLGNSVFKILFVTHPVKNQSFCF